MNAPPLVLAAAPAGAPALLALSPADAPPSVLVLAPEAPLVLSPSQGGSAASSAPMLCLRRVFTAGEPIGYPRAVSIGDDGKAYLFDPFDADHAGRFIGVSQQSAAGDGSTFVAVIAGTAMGEGFGFLPGVRYYAGADGQLVTAPPPGAVLDQYAGTGVDGDKMLTGQHEPVEIA